MYIAAIEGECLIGYSITWSAPPSSVSGKVRPSQKNPSHLPTK